MKARRAPNKHISTGSHPITPYQFTVSLSASWPTVTLLPRVKSSDLIPQKEVPFSRVPMLLTFDIGSVCSSQRL